MTTRRLTISNERRSRVKGSFEPFVLGLGRLGLTPDALTVIGFAITALGAALLSQQQWLYGGLIVFLGGIFDMFDGTLARATGKVSPLGGFMDSVFDRAGEVAVYLGIIAGLQATGIADGPLFAAAALGGAVMVSYTRAKSDAHGFTAGTGMAAVGIMPREVRLVVLTAGLVLGGLAGMVIATGDGTGAGGGALPLGFPILFAALGLIAVGSLITVIQRILFVRGQATATPTIDTTHPETR